MGDLSTPLPEVVEPRTRRPHLAFFDREAPFGYGLVLPAVLYLLVFIAYPFLMSIYMSFSDAQAGNRTWTFIGAANYSKVESYELSANDFVIATFPTKPQALTFIEKKAEGQQVTDPAGGGRFRGSIVVQGRKIPLIEMTTEDDASFNASSILEDLKWSVRKTIGGKYEVVAHSDTPLVIGTYPTRAALKSAETQIVVDAGLHTKSNGTGVLQDPNFLLAVKNTFKYTFGTEAIKLMLGVPCALLLNRAFRGRKLLRGLVVIPWVIPIAISAQAWLWIFDSTYSVINWLLVHWHILTPQTIINFRGDKDWAMFSVVLVNVWRGFPFTAIVILAGLTAIPDEILERARLEGANAFQRFFYIIGPMVRPILMVSLLFSVIFSFTDFNTIWIITKGGPFDQTQVLSTYAYQLGVNAGYLGKGAAVSLFMFPIMALMVFFMLRFLRREEH
ncbi:MAG: carbohydrate ABC transporter permease [Thermoanaerobaculia bacterium]